MQPEKIKNRETPAIKTREWPCIKFVQIDLTTPEAVADFILWLCGVDAPATWKSEGEGPMDPEKLLETLWSWQGAPRKRMARLCWQFLVKNESWEHFHQFFTYSRDWLITQIAGSFNRLAPIQSQLKWVLEGFRERRLEDHFIGQGNWGEEWLLPHKQAEYVRAQLKRAQPDLVEEASNYEDALHYYMLPYFEVTCSDPRRVYVGELNGNGDARVWIEDTLKRRYPLAHANFPFQQTPGTGFSWGYCGSGPSALSISVLGDSTRGDLELAERLRVPFVEEILSRISWGRNLRLSHQRVLRWLRKKVGEGELAEAQARADALKKVHAKEFAEEKKRIKQIHEMGGLRMQRFDIVPSDFESALYVDMMNMFERAGWVLHCNYCGQPVACERSPRGNRQRARWVAGQPVYHEECFTEHRRDKKRTYWASRSKESSFKESEKCRARQRRKRKTNASVLREVREYGKKTTSV